MVQVELWANALTPVRSNAERAAVKMRRFIEVVSLKNFRVICLVVVTGSTNMCRSPLLLFRTCDAFTQGRTIIFRYCPNPAQPRRAFLRDRRQPHRLCA